MTAVILCLTVFPSKQDCQPCVSQSVHPLSASPWLWWPECSDVCMMEPKSESLVPALLCLCQNSTARTTLLMSPRPWLFEHVGTSLAHLQEALLANAPFPRPRAEGMLHMGRGV